MCVCTVIISVYYCTTNITTTITNIIHGCVLLLNIIIDQYGNYNFLKLKFIF